MNQLVTINPQTNVEAYRASTDAAALCKEIVVNTATTIQGRKYVCVEGWQAIAIAHGCTAGARDVERVDGGVRAIGEIRRMSDGGLIATAEGFVGEDEAVWYGGTERGKNYFKRHDYAIRAMAQTRAISRACRSAFAHVVVMMNAGLATTPAEEIPLDGFDDRRDDPPAPRSAPRTANGGGKISDTQFVLLQGLMEGSGTNVREFCAFFKIPAVNELPAKRYEEAVELIKADAEIRKSKNPQRSDIVADEIPY